MNYCDLNEYEDYIENIEFFFKEKCLQICIINSELKNRKKIYIKDIEEIYWEKYFFDQQENRKIKSMCDEISYSLVASESKLILYTLEIDNNKNLIQIEIGDDFYLEIKAKEVDIIQAINNSKKSFNKKRNNNKFNYDVWNGIFTFIIKDEKYILKNIEKGKINYQKYNNPKDSLKIKLLKDSQYNILLCSPTWTLKIKAEYYKKRTNYI